MKYYCPNCGTTMEGIFCDCEIVAQIHLFKNPDGRLYHHCGKPLRPEHQKEWESIKEKE